MLSVQGSTQDSNCPTKNYSKSFGEVRTGGGAQWCWANVAADLIGFNQGVKPPDRISTIDVGLTQFTISSDAIEKVAKGLNSKDVIGNLNWFQNKVSRHQAYMNETVINNIGGNPAVAILTYQSRPGYCLEKKLNVDYVSPNSYIYEYFSSVVIKNKVFDSATESCNEIRDQIEKSRSKVLRYIIRSYQHSVFLSIIIQNHTFKVEELCICSS